MASDTGFPPAGARSHWPTPPIPRLNGRDPRRGPTYSRCMQTPALASILVAAAVLVLGTPACAAQKAPEFTHSSQAEWLNSKPLRLGQLRGKVVLIEFWAFECVNCRRTQPWLHAIQQRYADKDFVIVSVHTPELPEERSTANVRKAVAEQRITNPVMVEDRKS